MPPPPPAGDFVFIASEVGFSGKLVKGAPYSADAVTETIQTLSDGNRIINRVSSSLYRDGEGRTRREQTLKMLGNLGDGGEAIQTIFINDPVAGVTYVLDTDKKTAQKLPLPKLAGSFGPGVAVAGAAGGQDDLGADGGAGQSGLCGAVVAGRHRAVAGTLLGRVSDGDLDESAAPV